MRFGHDDMLDFQVVAVIDSVVALEPLEGSGAPLVPDRVRDCFVAFGHRHGLVGLKGHLYQRTPGDWRFKVIDPMSLRPQSDVRIPVSVPLTIAPYPDKAADGVLKSETVNLGPDGVLVDGRGDWSSRSASA